MKTATYNFNLGNSITNTKVEYMTQTSTGFKQVYLEITVPRWDAITFEGWEARYSNYIARISFYKKGDRIWYITPHSSLEKFGYWYPRLPRIDGPAVQKVSGEVEFWINGRQYNELDYWIEVENYKQNPPFCC